MENATLEERPDGVVVTVDTDAGDVTGHIATAESLTLVLTEDGSTGYVWVLGEGAVPVSDERAPRPGASPCEIGGAQIRTLRFAPPTPGETAEVRLDLRRPWMQDAPERSVHLRVTGTSPK